MAITDTKQAKDFKAGAPDITLKGDLRPNLMMASDPSPMDDLNQLSLMLFKKPLSDLTDDEYESLQDAARDSLAVGGRAQYGLGSIVKSVGKAVKGVAKGVKKVAKSDLGKAALTAAALYYAPALFKGTPGFGPGSTYRNFFGGLSLPGIPGLDSLSPKAKGTLASFAIGSLGSAAISAAEAGGLDTSDPNAEVDVESIKGYLSKGYKNLNPNATDEEVFQFVQENTAEYRSNGGRIGYSEGTPSFEEYMRERKDIERKMGAEQLYKEYLEDLRRKKVMQQKQEAAEGGRIGFKEGKSKKFLEMDMTISKNSNDPRNMTTNEIVFAIQDNRSTPEMFEELMLRGVDGVSVMMLDKIGGKKLDKPQKVYQFNPKEAKEGGITEELLFKLRESNPDVYGEYFRPSLEKGPNFIASPKLKAEGGRIRYAMGDTASENAMQAAGIEGLPVRQNKAGVRELDLRETGGFIQPVGVKEKADDIPAMLSNNEFVFTADAVRAAGGGDIDKGAQLMYDTMKRLESKIV